MEIETLNTAWKICAIPILAIASMDQLLALYGAEVKPKPAMSAKTKLRAQYICEREPRTRRRSP
ncbi:hypothetical protein THIX_30838 [Thiomonas sp. X19]|uniref:hypothetical protein n=1 Tax=Thiomonas sp. X19 TaxID=1050370 RepID=UPI000B760892|nr:hypothetical protein [Thiomonas sp. X19]SCC93610.1 hypothetical protein THIX_30838 [Thiomonas sp. X19]